MPHQYAQLAFTSTVRQLQVANNSRDSYAFMDQGEDYNYLLSENEASFIEQRDSFYMASVSETDWPYVQHRGGPTGFMRVLDESTIGFADFKGNRQYVSAGNFRTNNRVSLFFMDYPNQRRLKLMGRIQEVPENDWETLSKLEVDGYRAVVERGFLIKVEAFDWNCPQHITPRFSEQEIQTAIAPLLEENQSLKEKLAATKGTIGVTAEPDASRILGDGPLALVISGVRQLTPSIRAYEFKAGNGEDLPAIKAGSHIRVPVQDKNGNLDWRHYSICSNPKRRDVYEIAVLNDSSSSLESETDIFSGAVFVHKNYQLGDRLNCQLPENYFPLESRDAPAILVAGGIGITPIKSMAQTLKCQGKEFEVHYAGRSSREMAFLDRLQREFGDQLKVYVSAQGQSLDLEKLISEASAETAFYICGPQRMIDSAIYGFEAAGKDKSSLHFEKFVASAPVNQELAKPVMVELAKTGKRIEVAKDESVLDALLDQDVAVSFSCKSGQCRTCVVKVIEGEVDHLDNCLTDSEKSKGLMCPCVSRAKSDSLKLDL